MKITNGFARGTSLLLAFCMAATLLMSGAATVSAAEAKPTIFVKYLGIDSNGSGPDFSTSATGPAFSQAEDVDKVFWVGVSVDHLDQVPLVKNEGVYGVEIGLDYNPAMIEPVGFDGDNNVSTSEQDWLATLNRVNMGTTTDGIHWDSGRYGVTADSNWKATDYTDGQREEALPSDWNTAFVSIQKNTADSAATNRFYQTGSAGEEYLVCLPFRLKQVPANGKAPMALKLARGSGTLVLMTGEDGASGGAWEKDAAHNPETNLKNIFAFGGDLQLFEETAEPEAEHQLVGLTVTQTDGTAAGEEASLYETSALTTPAAFDSDILEYYLSLAKDTTEVELSLTTSGTAVTPKVEFSTGGSFATVTVSGVSEGAYSAEVSGLIGNSKEAGFPNTIRITMANGECCTLKLRVPKDDGETGEARIELNYGNSPYGEIMKMVEKGAWTTEQGVQAKAYFDANYRYAEDMVPDGGNASVQYTVQAWGDTKTMKELPVVSAGSVTLKDDEFINYDKDETAMFGFIKNKLLDPGVILYRADGTVINPTADKPINRKITYDIMASEDLFTGFTEPAETVVITGDLTDTTETAIIDLTRVNAKPGIYKVEYTYREDGLDLSVQRAFMILPTNGDVNMDGGINLNDANLINENAIKPIPDLKFEIGSRSKRIYLFRTADVNMDTGINLNDTNLVNENAANHRVYPFYSSLKLQ